MKRGYLVARRASFTKLQENISFGAGSASLRGQALELCVGDVRGLPFHVLCTGVMRLHTPILSTTFAILGGSPARAASPDYDILCCTELSNSAQSLVEALYSARNPTDGPPWLVAALGLTADGGRNTPVGVLATGARGGGRLEELASTIRFCQPED